MKRRASGVGAHCCLKLIVDVVVIVSGGIARSDVPYRGLGGDSGEKQRRREPSRGGRCEGGHDARRLLRRSGVEVQRKAN